MPLPATMPENKPPATQPSPEPERLLFDELLPAVSRSFFLSLRILPPAPRRPIALAYLLARSADTLCDTTQLPVTARLPQLLALSGQITSGFDRAAFDSLQRELGADPATADAERRLLQSLPVQLQVLARLPQADGEDIRRVLQTLISGMELDLQRFGNADTDNIRSLDSIEDTEQYCYLVAGCVGEFWTRVLDRHLSLFPGDGKSSVLGQAVDLGRALQLVNILRDLHQDLKQGRCYLPSAQLGAADLRASDLLRTESWPRALVITRFWLYRASAWFDQGLNYVTAIPRRHWRLRLAALWPALIGLATLNELSCRPAWPAEQRIIKISRRRVYLIMMLSLPAIFSNTVTRAWVNRWQRRLRRGLPPG